MRRRVNEKEDTLSIFEIVGNKVQLEDTRGTLVHPETFMRMSAEESVERFPSLKVVKTFHEGYHAVKIQQGIANRVSPTS